MQSEPLYHLRNHEGKKPIMLTCLYNEYPLIPHFYILKLGFTHINMFFLIFVLKIDCGYSLEQPQSGGSNVLPTIYVSGKIRKMSHFFHLKITTFTAVKHCSILQGHVCLMQN